MRAAILSCVLCLLFGTTSVAQNIYIHTTDGLTHTYPLIDVKSITLPDNVMSVNLVTGDTVSWNFSTINFYEYDQWYVSVPEGLVLDELGVNAYPNPSSGNLTVAYNLLERAEVAVDVISLNGSLVGRIHQGLQSKGEQKLNWSFDEISANIPNGTYIVQLSIGKTRFNKLIILSR